MLRRLGAAALVLSGVVLLGPTTHAQDESVEKAKVAVEAIEAEYKEAEKELYAKLDVLRASDEYKKAREERDFDTLRAMSGKITTPFREEWRERIQKTGASYAYSGSEGEIYFAALLLRTRLAEQPGPLMRKLVAAHSSSEHLLPLAKSFRSASRGLAKSEFHEMIEQVVAHNANKEVKAHAHFARASSLRRASTAEDKALARSDYKAVVELMPRDSILSMKARGPEFAENRLQIGMEVPDIEGVDLDGREFKLSDYRGKVVMIDFWGDW